MTIIEELDAAWRQCTAYGSRPTRMVFGDGIIGALAEHYRRDPTVVAVALIAEYPDGYVGSKFAEWIEAARDLGPMPRDKPAESFSEKISLALDADPTSAIQRALAEIARMPTITVTKDTTWRDHFRADRTYGKKARRRNR